MSKIKLTALTDDVDAPEENKVIIYAKDKHVYSKDSDGNVSGPFLSSITKAPYKSYVAMLNQNPQSPSEMNINVLQNDLGWNLSALYVDVGYFDIQLPDASYDGSRTIFFVNSNVEEGSYKIGTWTEGSLLHLYCVQQNGYLQNQLELGYLEIRVYEEDYQPYDSKPYKVFTAFVTQTGENAPFNSIIFENSLGYVPSWQRWGVGMYGMDLSATVDAGYYLMVFHGDNCDSCGGPIENLQVQVDGPYISLYTKTYSGESIEDGLLCNLPIEVRAYSTAGL